MELQVGKQIQVDCNGLGHNGEGICRYDGLAIFVPFVLPGEKVEIQITQLKKRYASGRLIKVIEPSKERVEPPCHLFGACGGCQLQHLSYKKQLFWKQRQVSDALERIGKLDGIKVKPVIGMNDPWHYRNKMQLPVSGVPKKVKIGCYETGSHRVTDTDTCLIQTEWNNRLLAKVREVADSLGIEPYLEREGKGWLRHVMGRSNSRGQGVLVLVGKDKDLPGGKEAWQEAFEGFPGLVGIVLNVNSEQTNVVIGRDNHLISGEETLIEALDGKDFVISATSFFQVNPQQTEILYKEAVRMAGLTGKETVLDAYCGTGTIALFLAGQAKNVIGIERYIGAVEDARVNAKNNGISNCKFWVGNIEEHLKTLTTLKLDVVVVDPPRTGCSPETLAALHATGAKRFIYVSCNPATLARDAAWLFAQGWKIKEVQPVDMFPQTSHVECVALMSRVQK